MDEVKYTLLGRIFCLLSYFDEVSHEKRWEFMEKIEGLLDNIFMET